MTYQDSEGRTLLTPWEAMHQAEVRRRFRVGVSLDCAACRLLDWLGTTMRPGAHEIWPKMLTEPCRGSDGPCLRLEGQRAREMGMRALLAGTRPEARMPLEERAALAREMMAADPFLGPLAAGRWSADGDNPHPTDSPLPMPTVGPIPVKDPAT